MHWSFGTFCIALAAMGVAYGVNARHEVVPPKVAPQEQQSAVSASAPESTTNAQVMQVVYALYQRVQELERKLSREESDAATWRSRYDTESDRVRDLQLQLDAANRKLRNGN